MNLCKRMPGAHLPVALFLLAYFAVRSLFFNYPLIWDAEWYYKVFVLDAQQQPFDFSRYSGDHNSQLWLLLVGLPNYFFPGNPHAYMVWVAVLSTVGAGMFYVIISMLSSALSVAERLLATALFAFHPSVFVNQVHPTLDTGLLMVWVCYTAVLLNERTWAAAILGCLFVFTKEPAIVHLLIIFIFCALLQPEGKQMAWAKRHAVAAWLPLALMGLFLCYKAGTSTDPLFFHGFLHGDGFLLREYPDRTLTVYALMALVLNFSWAPLCLGTALTVRLYRSGQWMRYKRRVSALLWLAGATLAAVLAVRHYSSVRYVLPFFPAMLMYLACLLPVIHSRKWRVGLLAGLLAAFGWQNVRSVDPVSNAVFCHTQWGLHRVLALGSFDSVCLWNKTSPRLPKDELVYNLEFFHLPLLVNAIMRDIRPSGKTPFVFFTNRYSYALTNLDRNYRSRDSIIPPTVFDLPIRKILGYDQTFKESPELQQSLPEALYYIEFPSEYGTKYRQYLYAHYSEISEKMYDIDGYQLMVLTVHHRNKGDWCEPL